MNHNFVFFSSFSLFLSFFLFHIDSGCVQHPKTGPNTQKSLGAAHSYAGQNMPLNFCHEKVKKEKIRKNEARLVLM